MTAMTAGPALTADRGLSRDYRAPFPVNVPLTLSVHRHGGGDVRRLGLVEIDFDVVNAAV